MKSFFSIVLLVLSVTNNACAGFDEAVITTSLKGDYILGVAVSDQRETVLKWGAADNLIGAHHSGIFRNRKALLTGTGGSVATEMTEGLRKQLSQKWLSAVSIPAIPKEPIELLHDNIKKFKLYRTVLLVIKVLWVEAQHSNVTTTNFHFVVSVLNDKAEEIVRRDLEGIQTSQEWGDSGASEVFGTLISSVLADPEFASALAK
jgi:hypothetical protein